MKTIKFLLWLIILGLLALLIYQNLDYFMTGTTLQLDLKVYDYWQRHWQTPQIPQIALYGLCFVIGLLLTGVKAASVKFRMNRKIRDLELRMADQIAQINELNTRLEVFTHDPYIKKALDKDRQPKRAEDPALPQDRAPDNDTINAPEKESPEES